MRYLLTLALLIGCSTAWGQSLQKTVAIADTDVSVTIRIVDSTDGTPETGVVYNESGMDLEYRREGAASVDITEATLASLATAHTDGGFLEIGNGYYRLDVPDAAFATGADSVLIHGTVTDMVVIGCVVQLTPAVNVTSGIIEANVKQVNGTTQTANDNGADINAILDDTGTSGVLLSTGTGTGQISLSSGGVSLANTNITTVVGALWNANIGLYSGTPNSTAEAVAGIWADTNAVDTQTEMRTFLTGADSPVLAEDNLPSNFSTLVISGTGAVDSMVQGFLDSTIAETTANNIATNFEVFYDNGDSVSTSVIDDVQSGGLDAAGVRAALGMAAADLDTQLDGIVGYVDDIGVAGVGLSAVPWNASWDAEVQSEAQDALTASIGANGAILSAIPWNATWDAEVQSEAADAITAYDPPTDTEMDAQFSAIDTKLGTPSTSIAGDIASVSSGTGYAKDNVDSSRVWTFPKNWKSSKSPVTIIENASFNGTLKFDLTNRINQGAGALTITSVTCDPSDGITLGTPVKTSDNKGVMVSASGFESGVTYTFTVTHSTTDSDTALVSTGDFKAE